MSSIKVLAFCGSLRKDSYNRKLLVLACDELKNRKCEITLIDLKTLAIPLYDGDIETDQGMPSGARRLVDEINSNQALAIASPEYNGSVSGALKNAIDWATRAEKNPFAAKPIMLIGTSIGHFGASKSLLHARLILSHLQAVVIPAQLTIPYATKAFDEKGSFTDSGNSKMMAVACEQLVDFSKKLTSDLDLIQG